MFGVSADDAAGNRKLARLNSAVAMFAAADSTEMKEIEAALAH